MSEVTKEVDSLARATEATLRPCMVRLSDLALLPERFCHREEDELKEETLDLFLDSLILEGGVRVPVVFHADAQGKKVLVAGHRRVRGCQILADRNQPHFSRDMEIPANELVGASRVDLLVESLSDNNNRQSLRPLPRLKAVALLHAEGAEVKRAARALAVSDQTYQRDLRVVRHKWMFQHVEDRSIAPTVASKLIEAAEEEDRVKELREDLDEYIAAKKKELKDKARRYKAETGKDLRPADLEVKGYLPPHLVDHWVECLREHRRFDNDAEWEYRAVVDGGQLRISGVTLDLNKAPAEQIVKVLGGLSQAVKQLTPFAKERLQVEQQRGQREQKTAPYDFDFLRAEGLSDIATRLEERYRARLQEAPDGEEVAPSAVEERAETDLASTIELPDESAAGQSAAPPAPDQPGVQPQVEQRAASAPQPSPAVKPLDARPEPGAVKAAGKKKDGK